MSQHNNCHGSAGLLASPCGAVHCSERFTNHQNK
jgi:hypothetical protein